MIKVVYFQFLTPPIPSSYYCFIIQQRSGCHKKKEKQLMVSGHTLFKYCVLLPNSNTFSWLWNVKLRSLLRPFYQCVRQWAMLLPIFDRPPARCIQVLRASFMISPSAGDKKTPAHANGRRDGDGTRNSLMRFVSRSQQKPEEWWGPLHVARLSRRLASRPFSSLSFFLSLTRRIQPARRQL